MQGNQQKLINKALVATLIAQTFDLSATDDYDGDYQEAFKEVQRRHYISNNRELISDDDIGDVCRRLGLNHDDCHVTEMEMIAVMKEMEHLPPQVHTEDIESQEQGTAVPITLASSLSASGSNTSVPSASSSAPTSMAFGSEISVSPHGKKPSVSAAAKAEGYTGGGGGGGGDDMEP